jgi:hypothetical protein
VISRTIKIVVDTSGSQSASTSAISTFSSDIYSTVELRKMTYIRSVTLHSPIKTRIILLLLDQVSWMPQVQIYHMFSLPWTSLLLWTLFSVHRLHILLYIFAKHIAFTTYRTHLFLGFFKYQFGL